MSIMISTINNSINTSHLSRCTKVTDCLLHPSPHSSSQPDVVCNKDINNIFQLVHIAFTKTCYPSDKMNYKNLTNTIHYSVYNILQDFLIYLLTNRRISSARSNRK